MQKDIDIASAILHQAFRDNLAFDQFVLEFTRFPPAGGGQEIHATIGLTKPRIASIRVRSSICAATTASVASAALALRAARLRPVASAAISRPAATKRRIHDI